MKQYLYNLVQRILLYFLRPILADMVIKAEDDARRVQTNVRTAFDALQSNFQKWCDNHVTKTKRSVQDLRDQLAALQALDVSFMERGHVVIIAHVNNKDIVKIVPLSSRMSLAEYRQLSEHIEHRYGVSHRRMDLPAGVEPGALIP